MQDNVYDQISPWPSFYSFKSLTSYLPTYSSSFLCLPVQTLICVCVCVWLEMSGTFCEAENVMRPPYVALSAPTPFFETLISHILSLNHADLLIHMELVSRLLKPKKAMPPPFRPRSMSHPLELAVNSLPVSNSDARSSKNTPPRSIPPRPPRLQIPMQSIFRLVIPSPFRSPTLQPKPLRLR